MGVYTMTDEFEKRIELIKHGEVPAGYKKTQAGIIPKEWYADKLFKYIYEYDETVFDDGTYPVVTSSRNGLLLQSEYYQQQRFATTKGGYHVVPKGYITYRHMSDDGVFRFNINTIAEKVLVSPEYPVFYTSEHLLIKYLVSFLNTSALFRIYCQAQKKGSTRTRLYFNSLGQFVMPIPPIREQEKIVENLTHCDKVIELKKQLIAEECKQKKWLMENLLDPDSGLRLEGFEGKWNEKKIGDLFEFRPSLSASREQLGETGTCYLHYGDIHSNTSGVVDVQRDFESIPKLMMDNVSPKFLLDDGDVVFVDASEDYEGASKYVVVKNVNAIPFIAGLHTIPAKSKSEELVLDFKRYCFQSYFIKKQIAFYVSGVKVLGLSKENISKIILKYPSADEQAAIAKILSTIDHKVELLEQELEQWQLRKKSLMQLLLTGIMRVK